MAKVTGRIRVRPAVKELRAASARGLLRAVEHLLGAAQQIVPHQEGVLERTGRASVDTASLRGAVSFSGPYAVIQHEALDYRHDVGRQAKYLEVPMSTERAVMLAIIAKELRRALR